MWSPPLTRQSRAKMSPILKQPSPYNLPPHQLSSRERRLSSREPRLSTLAAAPTFDLCALRSCCAAGSHQTPPWLTGETPGISRASLRLSIRPIRQRSILMPQPVHPPLTRRRSFPAPRSVLILSSPLLKRWTQSIAALPRSVQNDVLWPLLLPP